MDRWGRFLKDALGDRVPVPAPTPMPKYESGGGLRVREGAPGQQNRAYQGPPPSQLDLLANQIMQNMPAPPTPPPMPLPSLTPSSPAMNEQAMLDTINSFLHGSSPSVPHGGPLPTPDPGTMQMDDPRITNWNALPLPQKYILPPPTHTPEQWAALAQDQKDAVIRMLGAGPATDVGDVIDEANDLRGDIASYEPPVQDLIDATLHRVPGVGPIDEFGGKMVDQVVENPIQSVEAIDGIIDQWVNAGVRGVGDISRDDPGKLVDYARDYPGNVKDAVGRAVSDPGLDSILGAAGAIADPLLQMIDAPIRYTKESVGADAYQISLGRELPGPMDVWSGVLPGQQADPVLVWVQNHPEEWANIQDVYIHGYDSNQDGHTDFQGDRAVWEYLAGKQDKATRVAMELVFDPTTLLLPGAGKLGKRIRTADNAGRTAKVVGRTIEAANLPNTAFDTVAGGLLRPVGKAASKVTKPLGGTRVSTWLAAPEVKTAYRQEREAVVDAVDTGAGAVGDVRDDIVVAEADRVRDLLDNADQAARERAETVMRNRGYVVPGDAPITPEQQTRARSTSEAVKPSRKSPKEKGWSITPDDARLTNTMARGEPPHQVDWLAREVPEVWNDIAADPAVRKAIDTYEPRYTTGVGKRGKMDQTFAEMAVQATVRNAAIARGVRNLPDVRLPNDAYLPTNDRSLATVLAKYLSGADLNDADVTRLMRDTWVDDNLDTIQRVRERFKTEGDIGERIAERRSQQGLAPVFSATDTAAARAAMPARDVAQHWYAQDAIAAADAMPPDVQQRIATSLSDWANTAYANYAGKTSFERIATDLDYGGRVRASAIAEGQEIPGLHSAPAEAYTLDNPEFHKPNGDLDFDRMFEAIVVESDFAKTAELRTQLYQSGYLEQNPPQLTEAGKKITKAQYVSTDVPAYVKHYQAHERYLQMYHLRHQIHAPDEDVLKGVSWMPGMEPVPTVGGPYAVSRKAKRPDKAAERVISTVDDLELVPSNQSGVYFVADSARQLVRRDDGSIYFANRKTEASDYAKALSAGNELEPVQYQRKVTPDVDPAAPVESPMRTFAREVEYDKGLDAEIAAPQQTERPSQVARAKAKTRTPKAKPEKAPQFASLAEQRRVYQQYFNRATKDVGKGTVGSDVYLSAMRERGLITPEIENSLRAELTIPGKPAKGRFKEIPEKQTTVLDVIIKHYNDAENFDAAAMTVDMNKVKRAAVSEIARLKKIEAPRSKNAIDFLWNLLDDMASLTKSALIANPFTGPLLGTRDMMGNWFSMGVLNGRRDVATKALNHETVLGFMRHNLDGGELQVPGLDVVNGWGLKPGRNVVDVAVRDIGGEISDRSIWERFLGGDRGLPEGSKSWKRFTSGGSTGRRAANLITNRRIMAFRHAGDQTFRFTYFSMYGDELMQAERDAFFDAIRTTMPNDAERIIGQLSDMRTFTRKDVFDLTRNGKLAQDWLERTRRVNKAANDEVNRVYFSYDQTRMDAGIRRVFLFHYWLSRHSVFHTKAVLNNPVLLYRYHQAWDAMDRWAEENDADNPLKFYIAWQREGGWLESIMSPVGMLVPYVMFADLGSEKRQGESTFDYINRTMGVFVAPAVQAALVMSGKSDQYPDLTGLGSVFGNVVNIHNWARNQGINLPGLEEGVTPNYVKSVQDRLTMLGNEAAQWVTGGQVEDVPLPDQVEQQKGVILDILFQQTLDEFGATSYENLPTEAKQELDAAIMAIETGTVGNERAARAYATYGDMKLNYQASRMMNPIPSYERSVGRGDRQENVNAAYDALDAEEPLSATEQSALDDTGHLSASPEARAMDGVLDQYGAIGTPEQQQWADSRNVILYGKEGEIPDDYLLSVGGRTFTYGEVRQLDNEKRRYLADLWLSEQGPDAEASMEQYQTERDAFRQANPELDAYLDWSGQANKFGARAFRQQVEQMNPNFARALAEQRQRLTGRGLVGEELEAALDQWATSPDGYFAYSGTKSRRTDPDPIALNDPTAMPVMPGAATTDTTGATTGSDNGFDEARGMPDWQIEDEAEILAYYEQVQDLLDQNGVASLDMLNPVAQDFVLRDIPEKPRSVAAYESWVKKQPEGADTSLEAYWAAKNAEYDAKQDREAKSALGL